MSTLALFSIKGGVGKTTAAVNLAYVSASEGAKTLLWDLDPQAAATYCLGVDPETEGLRVVGEAGATGDADGEDGRLARTTRFENLFLLSGGGGDAEEVRGTLARVSGTFDHVFVDCPAGLGVSTRAVIDRSDALIVPTIPTTLSTRTLEQLRSYIAGRGARPRVLPFLSMVDRRRRLHQDVSREAAAEGSYLAVWVPYASPVERVGVRRGPIGSFARMTAAARAYELMWSEIEGRLSGEHISSVTGREDEPAVVSIAPSAG